jgi:hypothetical protein
MPGANRSELTMTTRTFMTTILVAGALIASVAASAKADVRFRGTSGDKHTVDATTVSDEADDRLLIVNGKTGKVIYDDGKDDLFCVTRKVIVGYDEDGDPIRKRVMRCR